MGDEGGLSQGCRILSFGSFRVSLGTELFSEWSRRGVNCRRAPELGDLSHGLTSLRGLQRAKADNSGVRSERGSVKK